MKKNTLISIVMALAIWMVASVAHAQKIDENTGLVVWEGTDITTAVSNSQKGQFVYLVEFEPTLNESNKEKYLAAGSAYGVQGVMSSVGMRIQIVNSPNHYNGNPYTSHYQIIDRIEKDSLGFMRYKMVDDILLVFEVEVEGSLRNSGARSNVGYGCVRYAFGSEQII